MNIIFLRAATAASAFTPLSLFASGEQGFWFDPSDFSSMFQDSAGTTPVTAVGDPVGKINDKSGNNNHATQGTSAKRPILQQDGAGKYYLDFDGTDDSMTIASYTPGQDKVQAFVGLRALASGTGVVVEHSTSADPSDGTFFLITNAGNWQFRSRGTLTRDATSGAISPPVTFVGTGTGDISGDSTTIRTNGVAGTPNTSDQGTGNYLAYATYIGARSGTSIYWQGRIYGMIFRFSSANLGATTITNAETWMNGKTGAY